MSGENRKAMTTREGGSFTVDADGKKTKTVVKKASKKNPVPKPTVEDKDNVD